MGNLEARSPCVDFKWGQNSKTGKTYVISGWSFYILISINDSRQFFEQGCYHLKSDQNQDAISVAYSLLPHSR